MSSVRDIKGSLQIIPIGVLGGKDRKLKFDLNAFAELETRFGSVDQAFNAMQTGGMKAIRTILWAGLIHDEVYLDDLGEPLSYSITPYQVGAWISPNDLPNIMEKLTEAIAIGMPEPDVTEAVVSTKKSLTELVNLTMEQLDPTIAKVVPTPEQQKEIDEKNE